MSRIAFSMVAIILLAVVVRGLQRQKEPGQREPLAMAERVASEPARPPLNVESSESSDGGADSFGEPSFAQPTPLAPQDSSDQGVKAFVSDRETIGDSAPHGNDHKPQPPHTTSVQEFVSDATTVSSPRDRADKRPPSHEAMEDEAMEDEVPQASELTQADADSHGTAEPAFSASGASSPGHPDKEASPLSYREALSQATQDGSLVQTSQDDLLASLAGAQVKRLPDASSDGSQARSSLGATRTSTVDPASLADPQTASPSIRRLPAIPGLPPAAHRTPSTTAFVPNPPVSAGQDSQPQHSRSTQAPNSAAAALDAGDLPTREATGPIASTEEATEKETPADPTSRDNESELAQSQWFLHASTLRFQVPLGWRVEETAVGREIHVTLTPNTPAGKTDPASRGIWFVCHVKDVRPEIPQDLESWTQWRLKALQLESTEWGLPEADQLSGYRALRIPLQPSIQGSAFRGELMIVELPWGWCEIQGRFQDEGDTLVWRRTLNSVQFLAPPTPPQVTDPKLVDAQPVMGTWKAYRSRMTLRENGQVQIQLDPESDGAAAAGGPVRQAQATIPVVQGTFRAENDVLYVEWQDGTLLNFRWRVKGANLLLTDHEGRVSQLRRILQ